MPATANLGIEAREILDRAIAGGITESQLEVLIETYPAMGKDSWWINNAASDPVRAVKHRLDMLGVDAWKAQAKKWTDAELKIVASEHKAGKPVNQDKLAEAAARGIISVSSAMNSDF